MTPSILLIPGNMCDARLWEHVAARLAASGHDIRQGPRLDQQTIEGMAEATLAAQDRPVIAVGFSMGAIVAAEMARRAPEMVAALGLIAFNASADLPERAAVRPRQQADVRNGHLGTIVADELKPNYLADANRRDAKLLDTVMQMALALGPEIFVAQSEALRLRSDLRPALSTFTLPVLLACGSEDRLCPPAWHRAWADMIGPHARFAEIAEAGHLLPLEQPDALAETIRGWLAEEISCHTIS
jgi:pimeloyl-ACP methyl ester carboxylesterase